MEAQTSSKYPGKYPGESPGRPVAPIDPRLYERTDEHWEILADVVNNRGRIKPGSKNPMLQVKFELPQPRERAYNFVRHFSGAISENLRASSAKPRYNAIVTRKRSLYYIMRKLLATDKLTPANTSRAERLAERLYEEIECSDRAHGNDWLDRVEDDFG